MSNVKRESCRKCFDQCCEVIQPPLLALSGVVAFFAVSVTVVVTMGTDFYRVLYVNEDGKETYIRIPLVRVVIDGPCYVGKDEHVYPILDSRIANNNSEMTCVVDAPQRLGFIFGLVSLIFSVAAWLFVSAMYFLDPVKWRLHQLSFRLSSLCVFAAILLLFDFVTMASHWCVNATSCELAKSGVWAVIAVVSWLACAVTLCVAFKKSELGAVAPMPEPLPIQEDIEQQGDNIDAERDE